MSSSVDELKTYVRSRMPVRSRVFGGANVDALVEAAVAEWPMSPLSECGRDTPAERKILDSLEARVCASGDRYGFIWSLLLASAVSAVVRMVLE